MSRLSLGPSVVWIALALAVLSLGSPDPASAQPAVEILLSAPPSVQFGAMDVPVEIRLNNALVLTALDLPLEIRGTGGAFVTAVQLGFQNRLVDPVLLNGKVRQVFHSPDGIDCPYATATTITTKTPVSGGPVAIRFRGGSATPTQWVSAGADGSPSMLLTLDFNFSPGTIEIDTTCAEPLIFPRAWDINDIPTPITNFEKAVINLVPEIVETVWVALNGNDNAATTGTESDPFKTIQYAFSRITGPNPIVVVKPGVHAGPVEFPLSTVKLVSSDGPFGTSITGDNLNSIVTMYTGNDFDEQVLDGFTLANNNATLPFAGGAVSVPGLTIASIVNCIIRDNTALEAAGGIEYFGNGGLIANNWIVDNRSLGFNRPGGVYLDNNAYVKFLHNTVANNVNSDAAAGLVAGISIVTENSAPQFDNNIIAFNGVGTGQVGIFYDGAPLTDLYNHNIYHGNGAGNAAPIVPFTPSVTYDYDPGFASPTTGDYHLLCASLARDLAGIDVPDGVEKDIDGQTRPFPLPGMPDIGADEFYDTDKAAFFYVVADEGGAPPVGCVPYTVQFVNESECIDEEWIWIFGDGDTLTGAGEVNKHPAHLYDQPGVYTVTLIAKGAADSDTSTLTNLIKVAAPITADFTVNRTLACDTGTFRFIATANTDVDEFDWDFGVEGLSAGANATGDTVTFKYTNPGQYTVTLYATNACGTDQVVKTDLITIGTKPNMFVTSSHDSHTGPACAPYEVSFSYTSTQPLNAWNWDFGDNNTSTLPAPVHTYQNAGTYSVRLIGFGDCGRDTVVKQSYITVVGKPTVSVAAAPPQGCDSVTVAFSATITGAYTSATWHFGDGATAPGPAAQHKYNALGIYNPFLVVAHVCGTDTIPLPAPIAVSGRPVPAFTAAPDSGFEPLSVTFTDLSEKFPSSWLWTFGDGNASSAQNVLHEYAAGVFTVTLNVANHCGDSSLTRAQPIRVGGFEPRIDSTGALGDTILYAIEVDSIVFAYDRPVHLTARFTTTPRRGGANFIFANATGTPPFTTTMKLVPTGGLAAGQYTVEIMADDQFRIVKTAATGLNFAGKRLISVTPVPVVMDSTIIGNSSSRFVTIKNEAQFGSNLRIEVENPVRTGAAFQVNGNGGILTSQGTLTWTVLFTPPRKGDFEGTLRILSDDPVSPDTVIRLTGRGIGEQIPPQVTQVYPDSNTETAIDDSIRINFSEHMITVPVDTIFRIHSRRANSFVDGIRRWTANQILSFRPFEFFRPDDTITVLMRALVTDTNGNFLDGNRDGNEQGSPADDFTFRFRTGPGVYPGDANNDGLVNEADILPLGLYWKQFGPPRHNPRPGFVLQPARAWNPRRATYADADGNGIVDSADICPIAEFFDEQIGSPKPAVDAWLEEAANWPVEIINGLLGALQTCPGEGQGRAILSHFLENARGSAFIPVDYALSQNYPNPFNPTTVIEYALKDGAEVRLEIFDILGRRIRLLESGFRPAGRHAVTWDSRDDQGNPIASGVYFYRLTTPHFHFARKMTLLK